MRKTINILALVFFVWLVLNTLQVPDLLMNFLLVGALPGSTTSLSPTMMLAIMTTCVGFIVFELLARRFGVFRNIRYHFINLTKKSERLPKRRFSRV
jgi:uncharacterized membrane protein YuzA (DUF378 family)